MKVPIGQCQAACYGYHLFHMSKLLTLITLCPAYRMSYLMKTSPNVNTNGDFYNWPPPVLKWQSYQQIPLLSCHVSDTDERRP